MSTLDTLQLRKHDLRCTVKKSVKADGRGADPTLKVYRKILKIQRAQADLYPRK